MELTGPPRRTGRLEPACEFCGQPCTGGRIGDWRQVTGWVQTRSGGGAHGIHDPQPTGRSACESCMGLVRRGIDPRVEAEQGSML
jgi:hypothetical protein